MHLFQDSPTFFYIPIFYQFYIKKTLVISDGGNTSKQEGSFFSLLLGCHFSLIEWVLISLYSSSPFLLPSTSLSNRVSWMYGVWSHQPLEIRPCTFTHNKEWKTMQLRPTPAAQPKFTHKHYIALFYTVDCTVRRVNKFEYKYMYV